MIILFPGGCGQGPLFFFFSFSSLSRVENNEDVPAGGLGAKPPCFLRFGLVSHKPFFIPFLSLFLPNKH